MIDIKEIINEELYLFLNEVDNANFPSFGDHLRNISEDDEEQNQELITTVLKEINNFIKKYKKK
jgi:hypothetical protein